MNENIVPWLRSGTGQTPQDGGCIMQVIDWIDRNEWTDHPPCVHPVIKSLAISANDSLDDVGRQKLLDLAPRMMNTASADKRLAIQLAIFCAERVLPIFEARYADDDRPREAIAAARDAAADAAAYAAAADAAAAYAYAAAAADAAAYAAAYAAAAAAYAYAYAADATAGTSARLDLLIAVLDEYDRLTGRAKVEDLDYAPVCAVMAGASA